MQNGRPAQNEIATSRAVEALSSWAEILTNEWRGAAFSSRVGPTTGKDGACSRVTREAAGIASESGDADVAGATSAPIQTARAKNAAQVAAKSRVSPS